MKESGIRRWLPWAAMAVVAVAALSIGTFGQAKPTPTERAQALAATIRCPSCRSQSAATSDTPSSQAVRALIQQRIAAGDSDEQIRDFVASRYTRAILLDPAGSGFSALVWALPVAVALIAVAGLVFRFRDWRPAALAVTDADRTLVADALAGDQPEPDGGEPDAPESDGPESDGPEPDGPEADGS